MALKQKRNGMQVSRDFNRYGVWANPDLHPVGKDVYRECLEAASIKTGYMCILEDYDRKKALWWRENGN